MTAGNIIWQGELLLFGGMATALSFAGGTALAIKDIVEHPENAFVIGIVTDAAFLKTGKAIRTQPMHDEASRAI